mmetsp:Transcript_4743/g.13271  ORF Transcript_4743/g.13271 Transcript_4743/m.13271 type:complete len:88 (-) Transcript_4743:2724-2987(-)
MKNERNEPAISIRTQVKPETSVTKDSDEDSIGSNGDERTASIVRRVLQEQHQQPLKTTQFCQFFATASPDYVKFRLGVDGGAFVQSN